MAETGILLESGTNELEIVEFQVDLKEKDGSIRPGYYGVNVSKVREIIRIPEKLSEVPKAHPAVSGVINLRGKIIPVVDLPMWMNKDREGEIECSRVIIMEFNKILTGFMVHSVARIHRVSWERVESPGGVMNQAEEECVTGIVKFEDKILMMLDFERIVTEINPEVGFRNVTIQKSEKREGKTVLVAEDSAFISKMMVDMLEEAGYRVFHAGNGKEAYNMLLNVLDEADKKGIPLSRYINLLITDVEMPQMDGLHLTTKLKEHEKLRTVPIVVFSSLVSEQSTVKWSGLGVEGFITKPEIGQLVKLVDSLIFK